MKSAAKASAVAPLESRLIVATYLRFWRNYEFDVTTAPGAHNAHAMRCHSPRPAPATVLRRHHDECLRMGFTADSPADCSLPGVTLADLLTGFYPAIAQTMRNNLVQMAMLPDNALRAMINTAPTPGSRRA